MKKKYQKPNIIFEDFTLSTSIAAGCEKKAHHAMYECAFYDEEMDYNLFISSIPTCFDVPQDGGQEHNGICYHIPIESNNVFNS